MNLPGSFRQTELPMKRQLFVYMLILVLILLMSFVAGMFLFGRFESVELTTYKSLDLQMEVFERDISTHFDYLAAAGIDLSEDVSELMDKFLSEKNIRFSALKYSDELITEFQSDLMIPLSQKLLQEDCSGVFVMLETTLNSVYDNSRAGVYLQVSGYEKTNHNILLYRGPSDIARKNGITPHSKWRLEFTTDNFPDYDEIISCPLKYEQAYRFSPLTYLQGTSEKAMLLSVPITGSDGTLYGICGFEISESYFTTHHSQPSRISHLSCFMAPYSEGSIDTSMSLSCGTDDSYYRGFSDTLTYGQMGNELLSFNDETMSYVGLTRNIRISPNNDNYILAVMIPRSDYDKKLQENFLQNIILVILIGFFAVNCCMYFSKKFISPITAALEHIKSHKVPDEQSTVTEINDLFEFLAQKDTQYEKALLDLNKEKEHFQAEYEKAQEEVSRLAYSRKKEVDPDDYKIFEEGLKTLTPTEKKIFSYYLDGMSVKDILEVAGIKESTLRFHNKNIYNKLGVNSLKQLLRYATLMKNE